MHSKLNSGNSFGKKSGLGRRLYRSRATEKIATQSATVLQILRWGRYIFRYSGPISGLLRGVVLLVTC